MNEEASVPNPYNAVLVTTTIILPFWSSLYFLIWLIWDVPAVGMVLGVSALITLFCGLVLQAGSRSYDGQIVVKEDQDGKKMFLLELNGDPNNLEVKSIVSFKVTSESTPGYGDFAD
jgi:hypothetical protein